MRTNSRTRAQSQHLLALFMMPAVLIIQAVSLPLAGHAMGSNELLTLVNQQRTAAGVAPLTSNPRLVSAAHSKSVDMFTKDYWSHNAPDGSEPWHFFHENGYSFKYAGENLAKNFQDAAGVVSGWMNSPSHRQNILSPNFTEIGLTAEPGILQGEQTMLVVAHFGAQKEQKPAPAPASAAARAVHQAVSTVKELAPQQQPVAAEWPRAVDVPAPSQPAVLAAMFTESLSSNSFTSTVLRAKLLLRL